MISLVLMQNTSKMLDHNVLVRKAEGIETAGSLNILFSDKTGTITKGSLEVVEFFTADGKTIPIDELSRHSKVKGYVDLAIGKIHRQCLTAVIRLSAVMRPIRR